MGIKIDFTNVDSSDFEPIPTGTYAVVVTGVEQKPSKSSEYDYLNWELTINDGSAYDGRKLWTITSLSPKAAFMMKSALIAFGMDEEDLAGEAEFEADDLIGAECKAIVIIENYQGKQVNRVNGLKPMAAEVIKPKAGTPTSTSKKVKPKIK